MILTLLPNEVKYLLALSLFLISNNDISDCIKVTKNTIQCGALTNAYSGTTTCTVQAATYTASLFVIREAGGYAVLALFDSNVYEIYKNGTVNYTKLTSPIRIQIPTNGLGGFVISGSGIAITYS